MRDHGDSRPAISVCICTRNRSATLARALESISHCRPIATPWELLVVDNGSTDDTTEVVAGFDDRLPLRLLDEPVPGLSNARNRAIDEARGDWIVWTDDDVTVDRGWLEAYDDAIVRHHDAGVLGGPVEPALHEDSPDWIRAGVDLVEDAFAGRSAQVASGAVSPRGPWPYGANFALRADEARRVRFDGSLGRHPDRPVAGGEEIQAIRAVLERRPGWWVPDARLRHHIDPGRTTAGYLRAYYSWVGHTYAPRWLPPRSRWRLGRVVGSLALGAAHEVRYRLLSAAGSRSPARVASLKMSALHRGRAAADVRSSSRKGQP